MTQLVGITNFIPSRLNFLFSLLQHHVDHENIRWNAAKAGFGQGLAYHYEHFPLLLRHLALHGIRPGASCQLQLNHHDDELLTFSIHRFMRSTDNVDALARENVLK